MKNYIGLIFLGAVATATLVAGTCLFGCNMSRRNHSDEEIDGGVSHYHDSDAPKIINSTVITSFKCVGRYTIADENGNENTMQYTALIKAGGEGISCIYKLYDRFGCSDNLSFEAGKTVMEDIYRLFIKHDLAQFNGISYTVSGLPEGYGAEISIDFAGGEHVYSHNNQSCFLTDEFGVEFGKIMKKHAQIAGDNP